VSGSNQARHPSLDRPASDLIAGRWLEIPGTILQSREPANPDVVVWSGSPQISHVDAAVAAARDAFPAWSRFTFAQRSAVLRTFQALCQKNADAIAAVIRDEVGKVMWDAQAEAQLLGAKVDITLEGSATASLRRVTGFDVSINATRTGRCWFRPHGVMAVLGPFNFPTHLPNGHIVPALAMGNAVVFKPSDKAPGCGQALAELYHAALTEAGAPPGTFNLVQGGSDVAAKLASHADIDGVLFTGSWPVGRRIMEANLDHPGRILALEMGGNNAAVVLADADLKQAVIECVRSAFVTTGQRCTCTRRVIVHKDAAAKFIPALCKAASALIVAEPRATHPVFIGPMISEAARDGVLAAQRAMQKAGGEVLVPCTAPDRPGHFLTPGIVRVERFTTETSLSTHAGADVEIFGPLLRVSISDSLDDAIAQANATAFGLAASIFTKDQAAIERFTNAARAGCININTGTAGASSKLPFGGLGLSGNHRPAGAFSLDYCAYPVAGMIESSTSATMPAGMIFEDSWLK
jgi:succinylglutamic semialdehyde dehydrogenase